MLSPRRLQVPAAFTAPALDEVTGLEVMPGRTEDRRSALYDTAELDLTRWGARIEHDTQQGWRIELPTVAPIDRQVRVLPGGASVPAQVRRTVRALTGGRQLRRLVRLDVHADVKLLVASDQDEPVLLIADEEVSVTEGRRLVARFREQVIRPGTGATQARLDAVEARLCEAGAVPLGTGSSRLLDVLGPRASSPPAVTAGDDPEPGDSLSEVVGSRLGRTLHALLLLDAHVRLHGQEQAVAAYAAQLRHLRAGLRVWDDLLQAPAVGTTLNTLSELQQVADDVVAVDTRLVRISAAAARVGLDPARSRPLEGRIERDRVAAAKALLGRMDRPDAQQAFDTVRSSSPRPSSRRDSPPAAAADGAAQRRWTLLQDEVGHGLTGEPSEQRAVLLAELGVLCDAVGDMTDDASVKRFRKRLARHCDALTRTAQSQQTVAWLRSTAVAGSGPDEAFDAGQLAGVERLAAVEAVAQVATTWKRLGRPKATRWLGT